MSSPNSESESPSAEPTATRTQRRSSAVVVPHEPRWFERAAAWLVFGFERALTSTLRCAWQDKSGMFQKGKPSQPVIFCLWHNRLALAMLIHRAHVRRFQPQRRLAVLVSASRDGAAFSALLERFGVLPVRGSSSRRGSQALLELTSRAEQGYDIGITPDGPRGPRYVVQDGIIHLAQLTGCPIVPAGVWFSRKWTLKSWDGFQIPQPFARCEVQFDELLRVPREISDREREVLRTELEARMQTMTRD